MNPGQNAGVEIRSVEATAVDDLVDLWVDLARGQRTHGSHLLADANRTRVRELLSRYAASGRLLVASDDTAEVSVADGETDVVGFVMFRIRSGRYEVDRTQGFVENLYVVPARRREGIGSALLAAAEQRLHGRGAETVALEAMADNEAARRFYRRHGYDPHRVEFEKALDSGTGDT